MIPSAYFTRRDNDPLVGKPRVQRRNINPFRHALQEVYPHSALIELAAAERGLPHKHSKIGKYRPGPAPDVRKEKLIEVRSQLVSLLDAQIRGVADCDAAAVSRRPRIRDESLRGLAGRGSFVRG